MSYPFSMNIISVLIYKADTFSLTRLSHIICSLSRAIPKAYAGYLCISHTNHTSNASSCSVNRKNVFPENFQSVGLVVDPFPTPVRTFTFIYASMPSNISQRYRTVLFIAPFNSSLCLAIAFDHCAAADSVCSVHLHV